MKAVTSVVARRDKN